MPTPSPREPDAKNRRSDPAYIRELVAQCKARHHLSNQGAVAERIGVSLTSLKAWKAGRATPGYPEQFTLECMAGI